MGELGWELHIPAESCVAVYKALMEAGEPLGLVNAGYRAIDSLSIEKGYPHWHQELRYIRYFESAASPKLKQIPTATSSKRLRHSPDFIAPTFPFIASSIFFFRLLLLLCIQK